MSNISVEQFSVADLLIFYKLPNFNHQRTTSDIRDILLRFMSSQKVYVAVLLRYHVDFRVFNVHMTTVFKCTYDVSTHRLLGWKFVAIVIRNHEKRPCRSHASG